MFSFIMRTGHYAWWHRAARAHEHCLVFQGFESRTPWPFISSSVGISIIRFNHADPHPSRSENDIDEVGPEVGDLYMSVSN